jgi:tetratricopeptide (TPR) repeat protein
VISLLVIFFSSLAAILAVVLSSLRRRRRTEQAGSEIEQAMVLGHKLIDEERYAEALDVLDTLEGRILPPYWMASWLIARAFALAQLERSTAALSELDQAEALLLSDDEPRIRFLRACAWGNRSVAHMMAGRLEQAEMWARRAYEVAAELEEDRPPHGREVGDLPGWFAEHWWWRAEIARLADRRADARSHLARAAAYPDTRWGARAIAALTVAKA